MSNRWIRWTTVAAVMGVAAVAGWVSYEHALAVVRAHGETGAVAYAYPGTVDGLIYAASMVLLDAARRGVSAPSLARWMLAAGIGATLFANVWAGLGWGPLGAAVAAWPALALVGSYELLMLIVRAGAEKAEPTEQELLSRIEGRTALYRLRNEAQELLYIGITAWPSRRFAEHACDKVWWPEVHAKDLEWFDYRKDALAAELAAIRDESPKYNIAPGSRSDGWARDRVASDRYDAARVALNASIAAGYPRTANSLVTDFGVTRPEAKELVESVRVASNGHASVAV